MNAQARMFNDRQSKIICLLLNDKNILTSEYIALKLSLSIRTIKNELSLIRIRLFNVGIRLEAKRGSGYRIICNPKQRVFLYDLLTSTAEQLGYIEDDRDKRVDAIIVSLLYQDADYTPLSQVCDQFFVSRTTIIHDFELIQKHCEAFHLNFEYLPYYGIRIDGYEVSKRMLLQNILMRYGSSFVVNDALTLKHLELEESLSGFLAEFSSSRISKVEFSNLLAHLRIILDRSKKAFHINGDELKLSASHDLQVKKVRFFLNATFLEDSISIHESRYLCILLLGCNFGITDSKSDELTKKCLEELSTLTHLDFSRSDLFHSLSSYVFALQLRLDNDIVQNVSIINDIALYAPLSVELSYLFFQSLEHMILHDVPIVEIIYAAHFFLRIRELLRPFHRPFNILVVSNKGFNMAQPLIVELQENFSYYKFIYSEPDDARFYSKDEIQLIVTDGNYDLRTTIETIHVNFFLQSVDYKNIRDYMRIISSRFYNRFYSQNLVLDAKQKEDVFYQLFEKDSAYYIRRDSFLSYEINDIVLIFDFSLDTKSKLHRLLKPIKWNKNLVYHVLVYSVCEPSPILDLHDFLRKVGLIKA